MCDLTVTQLLLEEPADDVRGDVNGVQSALNRFLDLIKFVLVIALPLQQTFGYLIIASFACVATGGVFFAVYACKPAKTSRDKTSCDKTSRDKTKYEQI